MRSRHTEEPSLTPSFRFPTPNALLIPVAYGAGVVALAILVTGYVGETWNNAISFMVVDGWCNIAGGQGVGKHCFGDFGLAYGAAHNPYPAGAPSAANSPLTMLIFRALALFPYDSALLVYEFALLASSVAVIWWGTRRSDHLQRAVAVGLIGVGSLGVLVALDRGNHVALLVPLALWYVVSLKNKHWNQALLAVVLIGSLKFWGILFVVGLLAKRQYLRAAGAIVGVATLGTLPLALFPGGISEALNNMLDMAGNRDYAAGVSPFAVSIASFVRRIGCIAINGTGCDFSTIDLGSPEQSAVTVIVTGLIVLAAYLCLRYCDLKVIAYAPLAAIGIVAVPEGPAYQCVFAVLAAAIFLRFVAADAEVISNPVFGSVKLARFSYAALVIALVVSIVPVPLWQFHSASILTMSFGPNSTFRLASWTVPLAWSVFLALASTLAVRRMTAQGRARATRVQSASG